MFLRRYTRFFIKVCIFLIFKIFILRLEEQGPGREEYEGVLPRVVKDLFRRVESDEKYDYEIRASAVQIYNETVICLLSKQTNLQLIDGQPHNAQWLPAKSSDQLLDIFAEARDGKLTKTHTFAKKINTQPNYSSKFGIHD